MAIQKSIVDRFGATHATSYTRINQINLNSESAIIEMIMYHDAATQYPQNLHCTRPQGG